MTVTGTRTNVIPLNDSDKAAVEFVITPRSVEQADRFFSEIILEANRLGLKGIEITEIQAEQTPSIPKGTIIRFVVGDNEKAGTPDHVMAAIQRIVCSE